MSVRAIIKKDGEQVGTMTFNDKGFVFETAIPDLLEYLNAVKIDGVREMDRSGDNKDKFVINEGLRYTDIDIETRQLLYDRLYDGGYDIEEEKL